MYVCFVRLARAETRRSLLCPVCCLSHSGGGSAARCAGLSKKRAKTGVPAAERKPAFVGVKQDVLQWLAEGGTKTTRRSLGTAREWRRETRRASVRLRAGSLCELSLCSCVSATLSFSFFCFTGLTCCLDTHLGFFVLCCGTSAGHVAVSVIPLCV